MQTAGFPGTPAGSLTQVTGLAAILVRFQRYVRAAAWGVIASGVVTVAYVFLPIPQAVYILTTLLMLAGALALLVSGHIGTGRTALAGTAVTAAGWLLFALASLIETLGNDTVGGGIYGIGTLVLMAGLLVTGVAALLARNWGPWQRFTPFALIAMFWVAVGIGALSSARPSSYLGWWGLSWIALGAALLRPGTSGQRRG